MEKGVEGGDVGGGVGGAEERREQGGGRAAAAPTKERGEEGVEGVRRGVGDGAEE